MFLELDVKVYSSFDRSGTTGFKYSSLRASLLTVLRVVYAQLFGLVQASRHWVMSKAKCPLGNNVLTNVYIYKSVMCATSSHK